MKSLIVIFIVLICVAFIALAIALLVLYHVLGLKDILNVLGTMQGEMWDDLKEGRGS